ncbi:hypothetical protein J2Z66_000207 [Paenibacillus eucommiae]|uniref:Uncharacterized protein n=1 Tax=Paenibacillus eucommiae TaxID=1355755 RepID=A0ABS4IM23_9BACL|nr:hypothetical protein [Paenibacillus eucommiae]
MIHQVAALEYMTMTSVYFCHCMIIENVDGVVIYDRTASDC